MNKYSFAVVAILWVMSGFASFVFWWTSEDDFTASELGVAAFSSVIGPLNFFVGWLVMGESIGREKVLFKKRSLKQ